MPFFAPFPSQSSHFTFLLILNSFVTPLKASSKDIVILASKSFPFLGALGLAVLDEDLPPNPPPKNDEKISPKSTSPKSPEKPENPDVPYPPNPLPPKEGPSAEPN